MQKVSHSTKMNPTVAVFASPRDQYNQWRICEFISALFASLGLFTQIADYEARYSPSRTHENCLERDIGQYHRWLCLLFTVVSLTFQVFRHHTKHLWEKFKASKGLSSAQNYRAKPSLFTAGFFLDVATLSIFPYPYVSGSFAHSERYMTELGWTETSVCYNVAEVLYVLMFARVYVLLRCVFVHYSLMDRHSRFACAQFDVKANTRFTIRSLIRTRPYMMLSLFLVPISLILAVLIRVFERPYQDCTGLDFEPYKNSLWLAAMTLTTINYADFYPSTHLGRVVAQVAGIFGLILISMMVFVMSRSFTLTWRQQKAFFDMARTRQAALVILGALQMNRERRRSGPFSPQTKAFRRALVRKSEAFRDKIAELKGLREEMRTEATDLVPQVQEMEARLEKTEQKVEELAALLSAFLERKTGNEDS